MKKANKSVKSIKNVNDAFSNFSENQILSLQSMSCIRGGTADGSDPIIIIPPRH